VCGNRGDPCDVLCGGALCKEGCGGALLCDSAAVMKSKSGKQFSNDADVSLSKKDKDATDLLTNVSLKILLGVYCILSVVSFKICCTSGFGQPAIAPICLVVPYICRVAL
jgi:hypothetical protein